MPETLRTAAAVAAMLEGLALEHGVTHFSAPLSSQARECAGIRAIDHSTLDQWRDDTTRPPLPSNRPARGSAPEYPGGFSRSLRYGLSQWPMAAPGYCCVPRRGPEESRRDCRWRVTRGGLQGVVRGCAPAMPARKCRLYYISARPCATILSEKSPERGLISRFSWRS